MGKLFGTNGVRGIFGKDFNLEFINDLVISIANHFRSGKILVEIGRASCRERV